MIKQARLSWILLLLSLCSLISAGCSLLSKPASASFASVDIAGCTAEQKGESTLVRVRAEFFKLSSGMYRLQCQTHMVIDEENVSKRKSGC